MENFPFVLIISSIVKMSHHCPYVAHWGDDNDLVGTAGERMDAGSVGT